MSDKALSYVTVLTPPSPATSGTSMVLQSGGGANLPGVPFLATVSPAWPALHATWVPAAAAPWAATAADSEIVSVTAISTDTVTINRARRGSTARAIVAGDQLRLLERATAQQSTTDTMLNSTTADQAFATQHIIPANIFYVSKAYRVTVGLQYTSSASPVTLQFKLKLGSVTIYSSFATAATASLTNAGIGFEAIIQSATAAPNASANILTHPLNNSIAGAFRGTTAQPVVIDTTVAQTLTVVVAFGATTGGAESVTLNQLIVNEMN